MTRRAHAPKEAETWHLGANNAADPRAAVYADAHLYGLAGDRVLHLLQCCQTGLQAGPQGGICHARKPRA